MTMDIFNEFIDFYGIYSVCGSMILLAATIIYTTMPIKWYKPEKVLVRFVCGFCGGCGEARKDSEFECYPCKGTGIISYPVTIGHSFFDDYSSKLDFKAKLLPRTRKRFIGFQPIK